MLLGKPDDSAEENYTVQIWRDTKTGVVIREDWRDADGRPHRIGGPSLFERDPETQVLTHESWNRNGLTHRDDGPSVINRDSKTGRTTYSAWYQNGEHVPKRELKKRRAQSRPSL
jgi:hypothetical protein